MTKLMDEAIDTLRRVPVEDQDEMARVVMELTGLENAPYRFSPEELLDIEEAEAAAARGDFATDEEVLAIWAKYGS